MRVNDYCIDLLNEEEKGIKNKIEEKLKRHELSR